MIGSAGAGKSSLINYLGGKKYLTGENARVGDHGACCTYKTDAYEVELNYNYAIEKLFKNPQSLSKKQ